MAFLTTAWNLVESAVRIVDDSCFFVNVVGVGVFGARCGRAEEGGGWSTQECASEAGCTRKGSAGDARTTETKGKSVSMEQHHEWLCQKKAPHIRWGVGLMVEDAFSQVLRRSLA